MANARDQLVSEQFGPQARAYVASEVHAPGADLDWIEAHLLGRGEATLVDIGCGGGHVGYRAAAHVSSVTACDLSPGMLSAVEETARAASPICVRSMPAPSACRSGAVSPTSPPRVSAPTTGATSTAPSGRSLAS